MVLTSSYGAEYSVIVRASTSILIFSSIVSPTPMQPSSSIMVVMSCRCGRLPMVTGSSASRVAARIGSAAFLAPETRSSPCNWRPPLIRSLSMVAVVAGQASSCACHCPGV